jgi:hypothetical protein
MPTCACVWSLLNRHPAPSEHRAFTQHGVGCVGGGSQIQWDVDHFAGGIVMQDTLRLAAATTTSAAVQQQRQVSAVLRPTPNNATAALPCGPAPLLSEVVGVGSSCTN